MLIPIARLNATNATYQYDLLNRLMQLTDSGALNTTFASDTNGNLTSKTDLSGTWTYTWDYENRLKQASKSGGVTVTYSYDALGRRVQRTSLAAQRDRMTALSLLSVSVTCVISQDALEVGETDPETGLAQKVEIPPTSVGGWFRSGLRHL